MVKSGLEQYLLKISRLGSRKKFGVLCHAPSVLPDFTHIINAFIARKISIGAIFGPQHGLFGQTQDNMIEWEGEAGHKICRYPVFSLYGENRKPTPAMLENIDVFLIDLQDVGARPYTYIWTVKLCMEACAEAGIEVVLCDRPNPIGGIAMDGGLLASDHFTFVGGANIPLCHRMTMGEIAILIRDMFVPSCNLTISWMTNWSRSMMFSETELPWVIPSPNMPTEHSAIVYPGMVLLEATNISEGRGSTIPFELFGAPYINPESLILLLNETKLPGAILRRHDFIPTFNKWRNDDCFGFQLHVIDRSCFRPVQVACKIIDIVHKASDGNFRFVDPPYEYEFDKMPIDILAGDHRFRTSVEHSNDLTDLFEAWDDECLSFVNRHSEYYYYPEN